MRLKSLVLASALAFASIAHASPQVEALGNCIAENTTGKDRKDLARWLFVAMSAHPEMKSISNVTAQETEEVSRVAGALFTKLLADSCPSQVRAAIQAGGPVAIQSAFTVLGQLAMQELMTNKDVAGTMGVLERHIDRQKIDALNR